MPYVATSCVHRCPSAGTSTVRTPPPDVQPTASLTTSPVTSSTAVRQSVQWLAETNGAIDSPCERNGDASLCMNGEPSIGTERSAPPWTSSNETAVGAQELT